MNGWMAAGPAQTPGNINVADKDLNGEENYGGYGRKLSFYSRLVNGSHAIIGNLVMKITYPKPETLEKPNKGR
ncbi:hypothetical protein [Syntrophomonas erecta]